MVKVQGNVQKVCRKRNWRDPSRLGVKAVQGFLGGLLQLIRVWVRMVGRHTHFRAGLHIEVRARRFLTASDWLRCSDKTIVSSALIAARNDDALQGVLCHGVACRRRQVQMLSFLVKSGW